MIYTPNSQSGEVPQAPGPENAGPYDAEAGEAGWDSPERAQKLVESFVARGTKVLDIGVGTGQAVRGYSEKGAIVIGLDHDQDMLDKARTITGESADLRVADINKLLPVEDLTGQIDVAQAVGVLEFAENIGDVFQQVRDVLKDNGVFVFTIEVSKSGDNNAVEHYPEAGVTVHRHSIEEINALLKENGFTLIKDEGYGGYERGDVGAGKVPYHIFLAQKISPKTMYE